MSEAGKISRSKLRKSLELVSYCYAETCLNSQRDWVRVVAENRAPSHPPAKSWFTVEAHFPALCSFFSTPSPVLHSRQAHPVLGPKKKGEAEGRVLGL